MVRKILQSDLFITLSLGVATLVLVPLVGLRVLRIIAGLVAVSIAFGFVLSLYRMGKDERPTGPFDVLLFVGYVVGMIFYIHHLVQVLLLQGYFIEFVITIVSTGLLIAYVAYNTVWRGVKAKATIERQDNQHKKKQQMERDPP